MSQDGEPLTERIDDPEARFDGEVGRTSVYLICDPDEKIALVEEVLADLPEWFGRPEANRNYIESSKDLPVWGAFTEVGDIEIPVGFVALQQTSPFTAEIFVIGIKQDFHRFGIGTQLVETVISHCQDKYLLLQVKTVQEGKYQVYDRTVAFYRSMGFIDLEVFPELWDPETPCLVMVMPLEESSVSRRLCADLMDQ